MIAGRDASRWLRAAVPGAALLIALWSALPLSVPFVGTRPAVLAATWRLWAWGTGIAIGVTILAHVLTRDRLPGLLERAGSAVMAVPARAFAVGGAAVFAAGALAFTLFVFAGNPRNVDGFAQLFQARMYLAGRLWMPAPAEPASFGTLHMILGPERWYSQYPPGQSLVLAVGLALGAWWALIPLWAAALVLLTRRLGSWVGDAATGRLAVVLLCLSPFALAVSGSEMSHLPAAVLGAGAAAAATCTGGKRPALRAAVAGALLGVMSAFRPLDAVAAALPVGLIILLETRAFLRVLSGVVAGGLIGAFPTLWYNAATTGSWETFGYVALWGPNHSLGFHPVPWGVPLTPARAVGLTALDLHQLNQYLFDFPFPLLMLVGGAVLLARRRVGVRDAVAWAGLLGLMALLFFYWHRDVFYGPRFLFSALPWIALIVARALQLLVREAPARRGLALAPAAVAIGFAVGLVLMAPDRVRAYRESTSTLDLHPDRTARAAGIAHAVVVIPDGWGSRLIARMWAAGVPMRRSTGLYAAIDACTLERALSRAERDSAARATLVPTLDSLAALGRPGTPAGLTEDRALRLRPGPLPTECADEIAFDRKGFLAFAPFLYLNSATLDGPIVWARDLRDGNDALFRRYPGRTFYRYGPPAPGEPPRFELLSPPDGPLPDAPARS